MPLLLELESDAVWHQREMLFLLLQKLKIMAPFKTLNFSLLIILILYSCHQDGMEVIERYDNGKPKKAISEVNENNVTYKLLFYTKEGYLDCESWTKDHELNGETKCYHPSGALQAIFYYKDGLKYGKGVEYYEDGNIHKYIFYIKGKDVSDRTYSKNGETLFTFYSPIIEIEKDTIHRGESTLQFKVSLPIHDTLLAGKEFVFAYQLKSLDLKDSIIIPKYQIPISNNKPITGTLKIEERKNQLFYGHLVDEKKDIYDPFEKEIIVVENKLQ